MLGYWLIFSSAVGLFFGLRFFCNLLINKIFSKNESSFNYDVFISFRGKDTRSSFTASLYRTLCQNGIHTFIDEEELQIGNSIRKSLLEAIQKSRILIVVLSENYASSSFCLDELVDILGHSRNNKDASVWPIFYKVHPSDVRNQKGKFREAFANHETKKVKASVLKKWKQALKEVANISGFTFKHGNESRDNDTIQKIVKGVIKLASLQGQEPITLHDLIKSMIQNKESSKVLNMRKFQMDWTVELRQGQTNEPNIHVKIQLRKHCQFGEQFFIVGDHPTLGEWDPSNALPMTWSQGDVWTSELDIPAAAGKSIQFKFILRGPIVWQPGPDRILPPLETMSGVTIREDW